MIRRGTSIGLVAPKIWKFPDPRNSVIVSGLAGKNVFRCQRVNPYHTRLSPSVAMVTSK